MSQPFQLLSTLDSAKATYNSAVESLKGPFADTEAAVHARANKNAAWFALDAARRAIQDYIRR